MKILVTGVTGYVARFLCKELVRLGHEIYGVTRNPETARLKVSFPCHLIKMDQVSNLKGIEVVINLAGASVAGGRWTKKFKKELVDSRVDLTQELIRNLDQSQLKVFLSASAIGYYADGGDEEIGEDGKMHEGFIGYLCRDWEQVTESLSCRVVSFRIGVVLGHLSAALTKMVDLFKSGAGARLGSGNQYMSFIHVEDLVGLFKAALENEKYSGVINATSPEPMQNKVFTRLLARRLKVSLLAPPVPGFALKALYGEMAQVLLRSHRIVPKRAIALGYNFKFKTVNEALKESLTSLKTGERELYREQWVPLNKDETFDFFKTEKNLEVLTPEFLNFKVVKKSTEEIESGTLIDYTLKLNGIPFSWRTEILNWSPTDKFTDQQLKGPYKKWHHTHKFFELGGGTLLTDHVIYKLPVGLMGRLAAGWKVARDVKNIFDYRAKKVEELFGRKPPSLKLIK